MPEKKTKELAQEDLRGGKSASTAAGKFVREEIEHVREGKHGARSAKQAIAIGLSKARRAGVPLQPPKQGQVESRTRKRAERDYAVGQDEVEPRGRSRQRSQSTTRALKRESKASASSGALSHQAKQAAAKRRSRARGTRHQRV
jgi:hypothetical protein